MSAAAVGKVWPLGAFLWLSISAGHSSGLAREAGVEPAPAAPEEGAGEEAAREEMEVITVTTQRRSQSIQEVAGSVQAFSAENLEERGVGSDFRNLQLVVPGLQITNQEGQVEVFIRGVGSSNNDFSSDPAVATHYNGFTLARPRSIGPMFYDLERVEINKGPQGTLRGRNASAGTINILSRRPELEKLGGYLRTGLGNLHAREIEGAVNLPVAKSLSLRGSLFLQEHGPYYENALSNGVEAPGAEDNQAFRGSALWKPTERLSFYAVFDMAQVSGTGDPGNFWGGALSAGYDTDDLDDPRDQFFLQQGKVKNDLWGVVGVASYDFGPLTAEYNGGVRRYRFFNKNAQRPFQRGVNYPGVDLSGFDLDNFGTFYQLEESESVMHELRLHSPDSARLRWTSGAFYTRESFGRVSWDFTDKTLAEGNLGGQSVMLPDSLVESYAFYGDGTLDVTRSLRLTAGVRYTDESKSEVGFQAQYQFDFGAEVLADDVRAGTPGFALRYPSELHRKDPGSVDPAAQFLDAIASFGARDTLGALIAENPGAVSLTSTDPEGRKRQSYGAQYVDWRAGVEYDLTDRSLLYTMVSTGTRSGGINPTVTLPDGTRLPTTFQPEKLLAVELGAKNQLAPAALERWLRKAFVNLSGFYYRYTDQVLQTLVAARGSGASVTEQQNFLTNSNVGNANLFGVELSGEAFLPLGFSLGWNGAYLTSRYDRTIVNESRLFQEKDFLDHDGDGDTEEMLPQVQVNLEGGPLQNTSTWNLVLALREVLPFSWGLIDWTVNYLYRSEFHYTPFGGRGFDWNGREIPLAQMTRPSFYPDQNGNFLSDRVPSTNLVNLSAGATFGGETQLRLEGYVTNLTNEAFPGKGFVNPFVNIRFLNPPRTFGARITGTF